MQRTQRTHRTQWAAAIVGLAAIAAASPTPAQTSPAPVEAQGEATPAEQFAAIKAEHKRAMDAFEKVYAAAKTDGEREKALTESYPKSDVFAGRVLALARKAPKDPAMAECLVWLLQNGGSRGDTDDEILTALLQNHIASDKLGEACQSLQYGSDATTAESFLRAVKRESPHTSVRAHATFALAKKLASRGELARRLRGGDRELASRLEKFYGKARLDLILQIDPVAASKEVEACYEDLIANFSDVQASQRTFGEEAKAELFELRNLAVGKPAPEIEGEDIEGRKFKLSDYRGKVVFLDFWGYW